MSWAPFLAPGRDDAARVGRPKSGATQYYHLPGVSPTGTGTLILVANTDYYAPFFVATPIIVDQLAISVANLSAGNGRFGLYRADADYQPLGGPLSDSGDVSTGTTGLKTYTPGTAVYLPRGRYLTVVNANATPELDSFLGTSPYFHAIKTSGFTTPYQAEWRVSRTYAAFPTPGTAWTTTTAFGTSIQRFMVALRISAP